MVESCVFQARLDGKKEKGESELCGQGSKESAVCADFRCP